MLRTLEFIVKVKGPTLKKQSRKIYVPYGEGEPLNLTLSIFQILFLYAQETGKISNCSFSSEVKKATKQISVWLHQNRISLLLQYCPCLIPGKGCMALSVNLTLVYSHYK